MTQPPGIVTLQRYGYTPQGTPGEWRIPGCDRVFASFEDPWKDNEVGESCIPEGTYLLRPSTFHRGGYECWEVVNVPGRTLIKIHRGNHELHTKGCPLVGDRMGWIQGRLGVADSRRVWGEFMAPTSEIAVPFSRRKPIS